MKKALAVLCLLLLAAPAGTRVTMGLDPGIRTGVKVAVVAQGKASRRIATAASLPEARYSDRARAYASVTSWCRASAALTSSCRPK